MTIQSHYVIQVTMELFTFHINGGKTPIPFTACNSKEENTKLHGTINRSI